MGVKEQKMLSFRAERKSSVVGGQAGSMYTAFIVVLDVTIS